MGRAASLPGTDHELKWRDDNYKRARGIHRRSRWKQQGIDMTNEKYQELFSKQCGLCLICGRHQSVLKQLLGVDHDHETGRVRGLLCFNCNIALGYFKDSVITLHNAVTYLQENSSAQKSFAIYSRN